MHTHVCTYMQAFMWLIHSTCTYVHTYVCARMKVTYVLYVYMYVLMTININARVCTVHIVCICKYINYVISVLKLDVYVCILYSYPQGSYKCEGCMPGYRASNRLADPVRGPICINVNPCLTGTHRCGDSALCIYTGYGEYKCEVSSRA